MELEKLKTEIQTVFPNAEVGRLFFSKQNIFLEERYRFKPENTRFAEGGCSDEINEYEYQLMERYWGARFKFGGLAGYCHAGKTGMSAASEHVPRAAKGKNLILVAGPHIGYYEGRWGVVPRKGQPEATASCGSLSAVLAKGYEGIFEKPTDPLDRQQQTVGRLLLPYLESCKSKGCAPNLVDATRFLMQRVDADLMQIVQDMEMRFGGQIAVITGITINTVLGNFFSASIVEMRGAPLAGR